MKLCPLIIFATLIFGAMPCFAQKEAGRAQ